VNRSITAISTPRRAGGRWILAAHAAAASLVLWTSLGTGAALARVSLDRSLFDAVATSGNVTWSDATYDVFARPLIVTSSNPPTGGDRLVTPGVPVAGIDLDGVGQLIADVNPTVGTVGVCSASLVGSGGQAVTAAHCVTAPDGTPNVIDGVDGNRIVFDTPDGPVIASFGAADVLRHPNFDGDPLHGFDVAVINLGGPLDPSIPRYALNTDSGGVFEASPHLAVGYGESGDGNTGASIPIDLSQITKRSGTNQFESTGLGIFGLGGVTNNETQLTADYDSGLAANDAFDFFFGLPDLGFGIDEVDTAPGDSGGPSFILDNGVPKIVGVHSYGVRLNFVDDGTSSDVDDLLNSSFGEFLVDARVAEPAVLAWLRQVVVPEPSSLCLLIAGLMGWTRRTRARR
jgi:Trypsin